MSMLEAIVHALHGEIDEEQIRQGVHDLGGVVCNYIVLFTPIDRGCDGIPVAVLLGRVSYRRKP